MARNKGKRKKQTKPARQPHSQTLSPLPQKPLWRRVPGWLWAFIVCATLVVTLLEGVPWLSIDENGVLNPSNPLENLFSVTNGGYVAVTDLDAYCDISFQDKAGTHASHMGATFPHFADYLSHSGRATIPCFKAVQMNSWPSVTDADLTITITYSLYP